MQSVWPRYMMCRDCHNNWRIEPLKPMLVTQSLPTFCPMCGKASAVNVDRDQDYWYILAEGILGKSTAKSVALLKGLYDLWQPEKQSHFAEFVKLTMEEHNA